MYPLFLLLLIAHFANTDKSELLRGWCSWCCCCRPRHPMKPNNRATFLRQNGPGTAMPPSPKRREGIVAAVVATSTARPFALPDSHSQFLAANDAGHAASSSSSSGGGGIMTGGAYAPAAAAPSHARCPFRPPAGKQQQQQQQRVTSCPAAGRSSSSFTNTTTRSNTTTSTTNISSCSGNNNNNNATTTASSSSSSDILASVLNTGGRGAPRATGGEAAGKSLLIGEVRLDGGLPGWIYKVSINDERLPPKATPKWTVWLEIPAGDAITLEASIHREKYTVPV